MSTHRISVDIPEEEHKFLKMCCAKLGVSIKAFVLNSVLNSVEDQEDLWWMEQPETKEMLKKIKNGKLETVPFEDVMKEFGINV